MKIFQNRNFDLPAPSCIDDAVDDVVFVMVCCVHDIYVMCWRCGCVFYLHYDLLLCFCVHYATTYMHGGAFFYLHGHFYYHMTSLSKFTSVFILSLVGLNGSKSQRNWGRCVQSAALNSFLTIYDMHLFAFNNDELTNCQ